MNSDEQTEQGESLDRRLFLMLRVLLGLILFPVVTLLAVAGITEVLVAVGLSKSQQAGTLAFGVLSGAIVGLSDFDARHLEIQ